MLNQSKLRARKLLLSSIVWNILVRQTRTLLYDLSLLNFKYQRLNLKKFKYEFYVII